MFAGLDTFGSNSCEAQWMVLTVSLLHRSYSRRVEYNDVTNVDTTTSLFHLVTAVS